MSLDKIPEIDWKVLETHYEDRYKSHEDFKRFKRGIEACLSKNNALDSLIRILAKGSDNPNSVYQVAYTPLDVINAQLEVDELNEMANLSYNRGEKWQ